MCFKYCLLIPATAKNVEYMVMCFDQIQTKISLPIGEILLYYFYFKIENLGLR